ncbi:hypothetical protein GDO81_029262 [Engystomops pustulosus]|uniref:Uncharacterized protein n=1 Tax=Engystomops pustulosus TaxID=76066 RepID=A0AAV6YJP0_ENGPU|nr:hypothetical protein GDO81_029262 [Engystomops pustulosus]
MVSSSTLTSDGNHSSSEEKPDPLYAEDDGHPIEAGIRPETSPLESATTSDTSKRQSSIATMMENNLQPQVVTSTPSTTGGGRKTAVSRSVRKPHQDSPGVSNSPSSSPVPSLSSLVTSQVTSHVVGG